jgi:hypothetical protein
MVGVVLPFIAAWLRRRKWNGSHNLPQPCFEDHTMTTARAQLLTVAALLLASTFAACTGGPTAPAEAKAAGAAYTTGHTFGSGNRDGEETTTTVADPYGATTAADSTAERSGHTFGSGN